MNVPLLHRLCIALAWLSSIGCVIGLIVALYVVNTHEGRRETRTYEWMGFSSTSEFNPYQSVVDEARRDTYLYGFGVILCPLAIMGLFHLLHWVAVGRAYEATKTATPELRSTTDSPPPRD